MGIDINTDTIAEAVVNRLRNSVILTPRLLTLSQAATYLGLTTDALKAKVLMGRIPTVELDKKLRFDRLDLDRIILEDYETRGVAQFYIATLKVKSILLPELGDIKATKLSSARIKEYVEGRLKVVKPGTVNRELGLLHRAYQLGFNQDPSLVARVPHFSETH